VAVPWSHPNEISFENTNKELIWTHLSHWPFTGVAVVTTLFVPSSMVDADRLIEAHAI
jgi:hypothetical protein